MARNSNDRKSFRSGSKRLSPQARRDVLIGAIAIIGLFLVGAAFSLASNDFAFSSRSLFANVFSAFSADPSISFVRNPNSPNGSIVAGRSQVLAVFDIQTRNINQSATIASVPVSIFASGDTNRFQLSGFSMNYQYCLPKGNIYAYGYQYGQGGVLCRDMSLSPSSVTQDGGGYHLAFTSGIPLYAGQVTSTLTLVATATYSSFRIPTFASVQASIASGVVATSTQCGMLYYGYRNRYGYSFCRPIAPAVETYLGSGNRLMVVLPYGYARRPSVPATPADNGAGGQTSTTSAGIHAVATGASTVEVRWTFPAGAVGYTLYRSLNPSVSVEDENTVEVSVGRNEVATIDTVPSAGTYYYKIVFLGSRKMIPRVATTGPVSVQ